LDKAGVAFLVAVSLGGLVACQPEGEDYGIRSPFKGGEPLGKADTAGVPGLAVESSDRDTQVWSVRNAWEDRDASEAKAAGLAWPANSGLNWDEKFAQWVEKMERTPAVGWGDSFTFTTPQGKSLPTPKLECSEVPLFLRVAFASWYGLPFYLTAADEQGVRVYFGHFGARSSGGHYANTPSYRLAYQDYSNLTAADIAAQGWPQDSKLRQRGLSGGDDDVDYVFPGARAGGYFDEAFLNKRVGYFLLLLLDYFGSMNLVDSRNTFNLRPEALRTGDFLVERWQRNGIGHTLVAKQVTQLEGGGMEAQLVSGSLPRRQPIWDDSVASKQYFTSEYMGGEGESADGTPYVELGGGLKRFRVTKNVGGRWTNTWMTADEASWISDTDYEQLKERPARFQSLLGEAPPEQKRDAILQMIADARRHLRQYPASCSARERRERAFKELYSLNQQHFNLSQKETDLQFRRKEDYVFAELVYQKSKTCCWNSSTASMFKLIMSTVDQLESGAGSCSPPPVFKAVAGGYDIFKSYAESAGSADQWRPWSEDEACAQRSVTDDTEAEHGWTTYCELNLFRTPTPDL
jgi:hypothetical protein